MKTCSKCKKDFDLSEFYVNRSFRDGLNNWCKNCSRIDSKERYRKKHPGYKQYKLDSKEIKISKKKQQALNWYHKNKHRFKNKNETRNRLKKWYCEYKSNLCCIKCGESHPACLCFHHRDKEDKHDTIANLVANTKNKDYILYEISKCDVLCHNCHAKIHWEERNESKE